MKSDQMSLRKCIFPKIGFPESLQTNFCFHRSNSQIFVENLDFAMSEKTRLVPQLTDAAYAKACG